MSSDIGRRGPRPAPPAPTGSGIAIFVTAVALVLGFLILKQVNDSGEAVGPAPDATTTTVDGTASTVESTTTTIAQTFSGTSVQVANCSIQDGVAKAMSAQRGDAGFTMVDAVTGTCEPKLTISQVIYLETDPVAKAVADTLAGVLGGIPVQSMGVPIPVQSGSYAQGSAVVLLLGNDLAGKTLDQIAGVPVGGTTIPPTTAATASPSSSMG